MSAAVVEVIVLSLVAVFGEGLLLSWFDRQDTRDKDGRQGLFRT